MKNVRTPRLFRTINGRNGKRRARLKRQKKRRRLSMRDFWMSEL